MLSLSSAVSFKSARKKTYGNGMAVPRAGSDVEDVITLLHGSDPVRIELSRLENEVRGPLRSFLYIVSRSRVFLFLLNCVLNDEWETEMY